MRNGADYSVYVNTGQEFDGSDSGASPDEAISWGKIKIDASPVKVCADATLVFPLIVSQTFVKHLKKLRKDAERGTNNAAASGTSNDATSGTSNAVETETDASAAIAASTA